MKLEYLDLREGGEHGFYDLPWPEQLIRLYEFGPPEAILLQSAIQKSLVEGKSFLDLSQLEFIELLNCNLIMRIADEDLGIQQLTAEEYSCDLTIQTYQTMVQLMEPFCLSTKNGFQWLFDIDEEIELLFSPRGTW